MKQRVILGGVVDGEEYCTSHGVPDSSSVRLWWWNNGVGEWCVVVGTID